mgnify:FL=1
MGKHKQFREFEQNVHIEIWVERINKLMGERNVTQQELAKACDISPSVISDYVGIRKKAKLRTPKVDKLLLISEFLGVSVDYLLGKDECQTPQDEKIHEITGLSDLAIRELKRINQEQSMEIPAEKQLAIINYLLENMANTELFERLYDYLIGHFAFPGKEDDMGAALMVEYLPSGKERRNLTFQDVFQQAVFTYVQEELFRLKRLTIEKQSKLEREMHKEK